MQYIDKIYQIYNQFLSFFPESIHGMISFALAILLIIGIYKVIKRQFIWLILLAVLLPASVPILKNIGEQILELVKFLLSRN